MLGISMLFLGFYVPRTWLLPSTMVSCALGLGAVWYEKMHTQELANTFYNLPFVNGMMGMSQTACLFGAIILTAGLLVLPFAKNMEANPRAELAELCALTLFAMAGALLMVTYKNLIMLFLGLEVLSISVYILTGSDKSNRRSNEAAIKYFLMGSFATAILLFGFALLYGSTGSFYIASLGGPDLLSGYNIPVDLRLAGMALVIIGILFKVSAAPFHFWTPDVYDGAPTVFTAFMSTVVKTAGFAAILIFLEPFSSDTDHLFWAKIITLCTIATLLVGNVLALVQTNYKRLLAYSSISHAGFMLIAVLAYSSDTVDNILFYSLSYALATVAAFGVYIVVADSRKAEGIEVLRGLAKDEPLLALSLSIALASLGGIPLTAGFIGKLNIFANAIAQPQLLPVLFVAIGVSVISVYYYFKIIAAMYMSAPIETGLVRVSFAQVLALVVATASTLLLGLAPGLLSFFYAG